jgi:tetratricopeptide (TPR) repeat protein
MIASIKNLLKSKKFKWFQRGIWGVSAVWAICIAVQSIPYYTHISNGKDAFKKGSYAQAETDFKAAIKDQQSFGGADRLRANAMNNLAELYRAQGRYPEAEDIYSQVVVMTKKLGERQEVYPVSLSNLANVYRDEGKYGEAEPLLDEAIKVWNEKVKKPNDTNYAALLSSKGKLYRDEGKYELAEPFYKQALAIRQKALGTY